MLLRNRFAFCRARVPFATNADCVQYFRVLLSRPEVRRGPFYERFSSPRYGAAVLGVFGQCMSEALKAESLQLASM